MPCRPADIPYQTNGSQLASDSFKAQIDADIKIADCERKRRLLVEAWPKNK